MSDPASHGESFEDLVADLGAPLRRYLERMLRNRADADDLFQETLIRIAQGLPSFEGRSQLKTWAFRIAHRVAIDHLRKREVKAMHQEIEEESPSAEVGDLEERLIVDEMNACVREVIDRLPPEYRAAIVLHDLQGLTAEETAQACECSLATAKIRIHRARRSLRAAMERECSFYYDRDQVLRCDRKRPGE